MVVLIAKPNENNSNSTEAAYEEIKDIKSFNFSYDKGYAMNANILYMISIEDGKYIARIKQYGIAEEDAKDIVLSDEKMQEIVDILNKYKVSKWDGFRKTDKNVLDGDSFYLSIGYGEDKSISASGYMKWPDNYDEVRDELDQFFEGLLED